jgi:hypothetical protein
VAKDYYNLFSMMEDRYSLYTNNALHIFALHYVYLPRINASLVEFRSDWDNHPMSTENMLSPRQQFIQGCLLSGVSYVAQINYSYEGDPDAVEEVDYGVEDAGMDYGNEGLQDGGARSSRLSSSDHANQEITK